MVPFEIMISSLRSRCSAWSSRSGWGADRGCASAGTCATPIGVVTGARTCACSTATSWSANAVEALVDDYPLYDLEPVEPSEAFARTRRGGWAAASCAERAADRSAHRARRGLEALGLERYGPIVGSRAARRPAGADAAVLMLAGDGGAGAIAMSIDGDGAASPAIPHGFGGGGAGVRARPGLRGRRAAGLTDCLNSATPRGAVAWQQPRSVAGLRDACLALGVPWWAATSRSDEGGRRADLPQPVVGMVGKLPTRRACPGRLCRRGTRDALVGPFAPALEGSELEKL